LVGAINRGVRPASKHRKSHGGVDAIGSALLAARGAGRAGRKTFAD
jgi:hypothetical protein